MADAKSKKPAALARSVVLLAVAATAGYFIWRYSTRAEGYTGGDVLTTGTVEAVHVELGFKVSGRIASVDVNEGADVGPGQAVRHLETPDLDPAGGNPPRPARPAGAAA